jgi:cytochrome c oxidase assembly protein subunit 15
MFSNEKKINKFFLYWLFVSLLLVFLIIIIGGLTRLTNSGLSITEWELFVGVLPPLSENSWNLYFEQYKEIPQFNLINFNMSLDEFKVIFYWEYIHRILARLIGLFFFSSINLFLFYKKY